MKKIKFVVLALLVMLAGSASLQAALSYSPPAPRTGETVTFTLSPSGSFSGSISWNFGDGSPVQTGTNLTITHIYAAVGTYTAKASYFTMTHAQVEQATVAVTNPRQIGFSPPQPKAGQAVTFTAQNFFSACIRWDFGDGTVKNGAANESHTYASAGSYTVRAYEECGSTYGTTVIVTVAVGIPRQIGFSPPQPKAGQAVTFTAQNFFSTCIRWDFGDGTVKNGVTSENHTYANAGNYTVRAYEECGNTYGAEVMVTVTKQDVEPPPTVPSLAVTFINLYFNGGKADVSVAKDYAPLHAYADIKVTGSGILQWQWLVDGMVVRADTLAVSLAGKFTLDSGKVPGLPTAVPGRHLVTLRFQQPAMGMSFAMPTITYFVALRGPAPMIRRVTPATLAPGAEYKLDLEGTDLTSGTEISFPAPLAIVKKANILSPMHAQVIVFVAPTAAAGTKPVTARNEYGQTDGPGQVTIAVPKPAPLPVPPDRIRRVTFTCPAGSESWLPGTPIQITYSFSWAVNRHYVQLYKNNTYLGPMHTNSNSYQPGQSITLNWRAGEIADLNTHPITNTFVPAGSGYRIAISLTSYFSDPMAFSHPFTIIDYSTFFARFNAIYFGPNPDPNDCPQCLELELPGLQEELIGMERALAAGLYWKDKPVAELGKIGKGQSWPAKLRIKLEPEAIAAVKRGEEFELRLFNEGGKQLHAQKILLVQRLNPVTALPPKPGPNPPTPISITFTSPTGGEAWGSGTTHAINYNLAILAGQYQLCLMQNGSFVGYIMFYNNFQQSGYPPGDYTYPWQVGKVMMEDEVPFWAPIGSGYTICAGCCGSGAPPYGLSNEFTISYDFSGLIKKMEKIGLFRLPQPGGCPECFVLDLEGLQGELLKMDETMAAGLYWQGKAMADLGKFGKGQGFAAKLQIKLGSEALAAVKRGNKFELRLFDGVGKQIHSQTTQLVLPPDPNPLPKPLTCTDIAVTGIKATLVSTQLGEPTVEFPNDKVRLEITIENVGSKAVPSDFMMDLFVRRNGEKVFSQGYPIWSTTLGAPGSRFVISAITDSFPHGLKTTYSFEILPLSSECSTANNQAALDIDETQLHPGGTPDLTLSIFMVEKRWHQEGDQFKGTCYFSADVTNIGSGYCGDGSRTVDLEFIRVAGNRILAFIRIPENELPGPGSKKRFSVEVPDSQEPPGVTPVVAFINPAHNETKKANNWAKNGATLNNDLESPLKSSARISFPTWGMNGRILRVRLEIHNLKQQPLQNLRLILLKNGEQIKEWRSVALAPGGSSGSRYHYVDERPVIEADTAKDEYKVILTTNNDNGLPPDNTIMDSQIRPLKWMDLVNNIVQELLRNEKDGIKAQLEKEDKNIRIYSNKTKTKISPESFYIYIEGKKKKLGTWHEFQASVWLKVHARNGQIAADVIDKKLTLGSEAEKILIAIFLPGIGYGIQHGIEKAFMSAIPNDLGIGSLPVSPCGIVLRDGALYLYHPY